MADRLVLVRHGSVAPAYHKCCLGATDVALDPKGRRQADALAEELCQRSIGGCFCSPLRRSVETAQAVSKTLGRDFSTDADLREVDFGRWEGKTFQEIETSDPKRVIQWAHFGRNFVFPEGEAIKDFHHRVQRVARRLAREPAEAVLAVTHGGVIKTLLCMLLGLDPRNYIIFDVAYASISTVRLFDGKGVLAELNNCSHLERH